LFVACLLPLPSCCMWVYCLDVLVTVLLSALSCCSCVHWVDVALLCTCAYCSAALFMLSCSFVWVFTELLCPLVVLSSCYSHVYVLLWWCSCLVILQFNTVLNMDCLHVITYSCTCSFVYSCICSFVLLPWTFFVESFMLHVHWDDLWCFDHVPCWVELVHLNWRGSVHLYIYKQPFKGFPVPEKYWYNRYCTRC